MTDAIETLFDYLRDIGLTKNETITSFVDKARAELAEYQLDHDDRNKWHGIEKPAMFERLVSMEKERDAARAELAELRGDRRILKQIVAVCESPSALYDAIEEARDHLNKRTVAKNATVEEADSDEN